ncbi:hypothetical protein GWI33_021774 [Rhynchophorus ferrugineus]|uniref:Uncharacterized protein n=1 Tax=Rhynchophorus ferrugineus TaxID=354439 RepID=A0A834MAD4_RHYFE|nr:hypothetical protein GWI33_021774 [Rhynchophorus ferrugineus]
MNKGSTIMNKTIVYAMSIILSSAVISTANAAPHDQDRFDDYPSSSMKQDMRHEHNGYERQSDNKHQKQSYQRGDKLPAHYYKNDRYYVSDWHKHDLREPPKGYRWVNIDGEYILVSVITGIIASILLGGGH